MKRVKDLWFPDADIHMSEMYAKGDTHFHRLDAALAKVARWGVAVDGGAHVGMFTRYLADRFDVVHAFEPAPDTFECLTENTRELVNVERHNLALGTKFGRCTMDIDKRWPSNTGGRYLVKGDGDISVVPLDSFELEALHFLKLDVEGCEIQALKGGAATVMRHKPIIMAEDKDKQQARQGHRRGDLVAFLEGWGYLLAEKIGGDKVFIPEP